MQRAIPYMQIRGGSSKGLFFNAADLPAEDDAKDRILLASMSGNGPEDPRQIDGLGGGDSLTSKVAIISFSEREDTDLNYEFVQIAVGEAKADRTQTCGNILAGVVPFAIETGMIRPTDPETTVRVFMTNSSSVCMVKIPTPGGQLSYRGNTKIDGVPGYSVPVKCNYQDIAGSACGTLLPTGNRIDVFDGIETTCIDNGMPVILLRAEDFGRTGYEDPAVLNGNVELKKRLESIRFQAGRVMTLGDVTGKSVPKMILISPPHNGGLICTRSFIPHKVHAAIGVLAAVTVATGCLIPGTVANGIAFNENNAPLSNSGEYVIEHPAGDFIVNLTMDASSDILDIREAGIIRTARALSRGEILLPEGI